MVCTRNTLHRLSDIATKVQAATYMDIILIRAQSTLGETDGEVSKAFRALTWPIDIVHMV